MFIETKDLWLVAVSVLGIYLLAWHSSYYSRLGGYFIAVYTTVAITNGYGVSRGFLHIILLVGLVTGCKYLVKKRP